MSDDSKQIYRKMLVAAELNLPSHLDRDLARKMTIELMQAIVTEHGLERAQALIKSAAKAAGFNPDDFDITKISQ